MLACGIALLAMASHGSEQALRPLLAAGGVLLVNGLGLLALRAAPEVRYGVWCIAAGALLFSVSVLIGFHFGTRAPLAPVGGGLMMLGWLVSAAELLLGRTSSRTELH